MAGKCLNLAGKHVYLPGFSCTCQAYASISLPGTLIYLPGFQLYSAQSTPPSPCHPELLRPVYSTPTTATGSSASRGPALAPSVATLSLSSHLLYSCRLSTPKAGHPTHLSPATRRRRRRLEEGKHARARVGEWKERRTRRGVRRTAPRPATWCTRRSRREGVAGRVVVVATCLSRPPASPCLMCTATRYRGAL